MTNVSVLRTTTYLADVLDTLCGEGADVSDEITAHLTPAQHDHINFHGRTASTGTELSRERRRPVRQPA